MTKKNMQQISTFIPLSWKPILEQEARIRAVQEERNINYIDSHNFKCSSKISNKQVIFNFQKDKNYKINFISPSYNESISVINEDNDTKVYVHQVARNVIPN